MTDQSGVSDDQKSVARQIEHGRAFGISKGWVADEHVYVDDGISGAEFTNRPGFQRLMNALKPRPPFQILIMSEESRLGREAIETMHALKRLALAGVRVFCYLEDRELAIGTFQDNTLTFLRAQFAAEEREKSSQRTTDAMHRKALAGHVCGGRTFGYDNVTIAGPNGERAHVERRINANEAAVVRRIFDLCAAGTGYTKTAKLLNAERSSSPRPQQGRPAGWSPSTVNSILHNEVYRGRIVWNRTKKRDRWGQRKYRPRPEAEWLTREAPELRIVSETQWLSVSAIPSKVRASRWNFRMRSRRLIPGSQRWPERTSCAVRAGDRTRTLLRIVAGGCLAAMSSA